MHGPIYIKFYSLNIANIWGHAFNFSAHIDTATLIRDFSHCSYVCNIVFFLN